MIEVRLLRLSLAWLLMPSESLFEAGVPLGAAELLTDILQKVGIA